MAWRCAVVLLVTATVTRAQEAMRTLDRPPAVEPFDCVEPLADGAEVRVVDGEGKPVAGAYVTWFEAGRAGVGLLAPEPQLTELRRLRGKTVRSGADGRARVGEGTPIVASDGARCGGLPYLRGRVALDVITLGAPRSIVVHARDRNGRPVAGAPIVLGVREKWSSPRFEWRSRTGNEGSVAIGPIDLFVALERDARRNLFVAVGGALKERLARSIDLDALPAEPIAFVLPPTGRVVVEIVDPEGRPVVGPGETGFAQARSDDAGAGPWPAVPCEEESPLARCELTHVEVGLQLEVRATKQGRKPCEPAIVAGPACAGEVVTVKLVALPFERLTGRLVAGDGRAIANASAKLLWRCDAGRTSRGLIGEGRTDEEGRITIAVDGPRFGWAGASESGEKWESFLEAVTLREDGIRLAQTGLLRRTPGTLDEGNDFGTIELQPAPLLVRGIVVDDAGAPVEGAALHVAVEPEGCREGNFTDPLLDATTGADGTFAIFGDEPKGRLVLRADSGAATRDTPLWRSGERVRIYAGDEGVRFVLQRCGRIVGRVVGTPQEIDEFRYDAGLTGLDGSACGVSGLIDADGHFQVVAPAGTATITLSSSREGVVRRTEIEIAPGQLVMLEPIVLAAAAHQCQLEIVDEEGRPIALGWLAQEDPISDAELAERRKRVGYGHFEHDGPPRRPTIRWFEEGRFTLRSDQPLQRVAVGAEGHLATTVRQPAPSERVVLKRAPEVVFVVDHEGDPLPAPLRFFATLTLRDDDPDWLQFGLEPNFWTTGPKLPPLQWIALDRGTSIVLPIRCSGVHRLQLMLGQGGEATYCVTDVECDVKEIDVAASRAGQTIRVTAARASIDAALAQLRPRAEGRDGR